LVLVVLLFAAFAAAQSYTITDLGPVSGSFAGPRAINNLGDVVIGNNGLSYLWTPTHSSLSLYPLPGGTLTEALGINSHGLVVGESNGPGNYHAVLWSEGEPQDLGTLPGGVFSAANAVNATGEIAGTADTIKSGSEAMVWAQAMGMQGLGFLPGGKSSAAYAINRFGQVVGWSTASNAGAYPYLWSKTTGMVALPLLPGSGGGYAYAINDLGQIAGELSCGIVCTHAVLWGKTKGSIVDLGVLPRAAISYAHGINNVGQVVGESGDTSVFDDAFVWSSTTGMQDLNNLIPANSGWLLGTALAINDRGQIVGYGTLNGQIEAFLLTPQ
jgi:probable HAF family extracellular repeat protein